MVHGVVPHDVPAANRFSGHFDLCALPAVFTKDALAVQKKYCLYVTLIEDIEEPLRVLPMGSIVEGKKEESP